MNDPIVIVSAVRTPMGAFQGELKQFAAAELGAAAIRAAVQHRHLLHFEGGAVQLARLPPGEGDWADIECQ